MMHTLNKNVMRFAVLILLSAIAAGCSLGGTGIGANDGVPSISDVSPPMSPYRAFMPASQEEVHAEALQGNVNEEILIARTVRDFNPAIFRTRGVEVLSSFELGDAVYYRLQAGRTSFKKAKTLSRLPGIVYVEHEILYRMPVIESAETESSIPGAKGALEIAGVLNDPKTWGRFGHFETTGALDAYKKFGFGGNEVYVAVIDSGINMKHRDFIRSDGKSIVEFAKSAYRSEDGGKTLTYVGAGNPLVAIPEGENWDDNGHGSHVSGTIAALGNNGTGVAGVAWDKVKLISYKALKANSGSDWAVYSPLADLIQWKKDQGITQTIPVNMSLGSSHSSSFEADMISEAQKNGILIVAAAGNDGYRMVNYPAAYQGVIAVSATRANGEKASFSTEGNYVSVAAPGNSIYSTYNTAEDAYSYLSGTSMATPFVTGLIAYMLSFDNTLTPDQIRTIIEESATDLGQEGWDSIYGHGMVNVEKAIERVVRGRIPAVGSRYATGGVKVKVSNTSAFYDSGLDTEGLEKVLIQQPVYLYDSDGNYVCHALTSSKDGTAQFRLLKPGIYTVMTNFLGKSAKAVFQAEKEGDVEIELTIDGPILYIQTLPNIATDPDYESIADSMLTLYDSKGKVVSGPFDSGSLDTLAFSPVAGETYVVKIECYSMWWEGEEWPFTGEYGLVVSTKQKAEVNSMEGRGDDLAVDDLMEKNDSFADAKEIELDKEYGLYLGDSDYFSFTWNPGQVK